MAAIEEAGCSNPRTVLDDINEQINSRLAAITPDKYVPPKQKREESAHYVVTASEYIRKLWTLRSQLADEIIASAKEGKDISSALLERIRKGEGESLYNDSLVEGSPTQLADKRMKELNEKIHDLKFLAKLLEPIVWKEIRNMHPDLKNHSLNVIYNDWSLCWKDPSLEDALDIGPMLMALMGNATPRRQLH